MAFRSPLFNLGMSSGAVVQAPAVLHSVVLFPGEALRLKRADRALYLIAIVARDSAPAIMRPKFLQTGFRASMAPSRFSNLAYDPTVFNSLDRR